MSILPTLDKIVNIQWNYFATSHGKGAVDGIGGMMKHLIWNAVSSRKAPVVVDALYILETAIIVAKGCIYNIYIYMHMGQIYDSLNDELTIVGFQI